MDSAGLYGAEIMLLNLAEEQTRLGHKPVICSIRPIYEEDLQLEKEAKRKGLEVIVFRMHDGPNFFGAWRILQYAWANQFEIIHSHGYKGNILLGFIPKTLRKIPLVSTLHGWTSNGHISKMLLYEYFDHLTLKYLDAVCLVNECMLSSPGLVGVKKDKLHIITNGIQELSKSKSFQADEIITFCKQGFTIVSIGRLSQEKGYEYLIQAFDQLEKEFDARLLIIGEGPERSRLENMIFRRGLADKIMMPGYRNEAWRYLLHCKVFVLSSLTEGLPMTLLEAMQVEVPVIATKVGGIPQLITHGKTGLLVPSGDPDLLCKAIKDIGQNSYDTKTLCRNAMGLIREKYSSRRMAMDYDEVYRSIVV